MTSAHHSSQRLRIVPCPDPSVVGTPRLPRVDVRAHTGAGAAAVTAIVRVDARGLTAAEFATRSMPQLLEILDGRRPTKQLRNLCHANAADALRVATRANRTLSVRRVRTQFHSLSCAAEVCAVLAVTSHKAAVRYQAAAGRIELQEDKWIWSAFVTT